MEENKQDALEKYKQLIEERVLFACYSHEMNHVTAARILGLSQDTVKLRIKQFERPFVPLRPIVVRLAETVERPFDLQYHDTGTERAPDFFNRDDD